MDTKQDHKKSDHSSKDPNSNLLNPTRIYDIPSDIRILDPTQLATLEKAFHSWTEASRRPDVYSSRKRILLIFLLIRYTGARLNEVLSLDLRRCLDVSKRSIRYDKIKAADSSSQREVQISSELMSEIQAILNEPAFNEQKGLLLKVDAGHVRRKFYEQCLACGFSQDLGSPNAIRRARAVELMRDNMPLPVVQHILGHSTPNLTASLLTFSDEDIRHVARHFIERENRRKTSARNTFFGKIAAILKGDIQSQVELVTVSGPTVTTIITNNSLERLGLKIGSLITAEIKAPWVILQKAHIQPLCTAENIFKGTVDQIQRGKLTTEFIVRIQDGTEVCSLVTEKSRKKLDIREKDDVWVMFNSFAVILHLD
ncbi:MAG: TOBE domain-containing protein [Syntrophaceae bacterium]|nr:TOBE domain-containing protein [Syntrophaceae bacterium]